MTVDAHHHLWDLDVRDQDWITGEAMAPIRRSFTVDDLRPLAEAAGVDTTVVVQTVTVAEETPELLAIAENEPLIGAVTGWVDLTGESVAERLAELRAGRGGGFLRGIRHQVQGEPDPRWLCRDDVRRGLRAVGDAGLVYELLTLPHQLEAAIETATELADVPFVLDHCSKPPVAAGELEPWTTLVRRLAACHNVTCKLSGLVTEADWSRWTVDDLRPYAQTVLDAFGPDRVMVGSDWPVCTLAGSYERVLDTARDLLSGLTPGEREAVSDTTARRVYRLG
ncbi:amidohydrolase family protein [Fodinicola acaciae]|uniref:amidohydrolase family protein n=1 Tax=Fodinicola acaciae TaxID=2681555 RepID=UPI0013D61E64|nr:amidohydrolase family protein [Fodinicola acaciae]